LYIVFSDSEILPKLSWKSIVKIPQLQWGNRLRDSRKLNALANRLNIDAPWNAPKWIWRWVWNNHSKLLPLLHRTDQCSAKNTFVNLAVLWWKAISGNRIGSATYDNGVAYNFLPDISRWIVAFPFCFLYPNLHHQNVALRTVYLDDVLKLELEEIKTRSDRENALRVIIVLGAGFDTRSLRYLQSYDDVSWHEIDLPEVIHQKMCMFERFRRRKNYQKNLPTLHGVDLNNISELQQILQNEIFEQCLNKLDHDGDMSLGNRIHHVIFLTEASLMYLEETNVIPLINLCLEQSKLYCDNMSFCFADRLHGIIDEQITNSEHPYNLTMGEVFEDIDDVIEYEKGKAFFKDIGLSLVKWQMKPGRAKHMGVARFCSNP
jgi:hypothetical protein